MGFDSDDMWRVWSDLERKEDELKWGERLSGVGPQYNSMGRSASASAHFINGWASEQMGRVNRVRKALNDSGPLAKSMIARTLSEIDLSTIWSTLVSACEDIALYYGGSAAAGGLIGGVGGAFFSGVGAVPGAAAGAAVGGYVGGWALAMLGLQSLVEGVAQAIPEALRYYEKGFLEAWGPTRHDHQHGFGMAARGDTSFAALQLANGHVIMISAILSVLAAYLTRGKGDMLKDIRQSARLGPKVATWVEKNEDKLRRHLALQSRGRGASPNDAPPLRPKPRRETTEEQGRGGSGNSVQNSKAARDARAGNGANNAAAVEAPFSKIVPGGGLQAHETAGGHLILKHVGQTEQSLMIRLANEPKITGSSSYYDRAMAENAVSQALDANQSEVSAWLNGSAGRLRIDYTPPYPVGISVSRGAMGAVNVNSTRTILVRDPSMPTGYKILTGFPTTP